MPTFSPIPAYLVGALCVSLGVHAIARPAAEYPRYGLPLEGACETGERKRIGTVSPLIYLKGVREATYGLALIALQYQNQETALTTVAAVVSLTALSDGLVVWKYGGRRRMQAWNHWGTFLMFAAWSWWRASSVP